MKYKRNNILPQCGKNVDRRNIAKYNYKHTKHIKIIGNYQCSNRIYPDGGEYE